MNAASNEVFTKRKVAFCVIRVKLANQIISIWRNELFYRPVFENFAGIERYGPKRLADNRTFSAKMAAQNLDLRLMQGMRGKFGTYSCRSAVYSWDTQKQDEGDEKRN